MLIPLFFSSTVFGLSTQLFLLLSEPVKATKCRAIQFIALVQSGICPKVIHAAASLPGTELKAEIACSTTASWVASAFTSATGQSGQCGNHL